MPQGLPARIDRAALDRIIQRAAELQTGSREIGDVLTPEEVIRLGKEVGIPEGYLRQAMLEETSRADLPDSHGLLDRAFGPPVVMAQRVVQRSQEEIEQGLVQWMSDHEILTIQRHLSGRISWEPLTGFQAAIRRSTAALGGGRRPFMLSRAGLVTATVMPLEPGYCNVTLTATLRKARASFIGGASAVASIGLAAAAVLAVMTPFWFFAVAPIPMAAGGAWGVSRLYRPIAERVQLGLERALDSLERRAPGASSQLPYRSAGLLGSIADGVRRALNP